MPKETAAAWAAKVALVLLAVPVARAAQALQATRVLQSALVARVLRGALMARVMPAPEVAQVVLARLVVPVSTVVPVAWPRGHPAKTSCPAAVMRSVSGTSRPRAGSAMTPRLMISARMGLWSLFERHWVL